MTDWAKPGKAKSAVPGFAQSLEIAKAIPTFPQHGDGDLAPQEKNQIKERSPGSFLQAHRSIGKCCPLALPGGDGSGEFFLNQDLDLGDEVIEAVEQGRGDDLAFIGGAPTA